MTLTVQQVLTDALSLCGGVAIDETPTSSELNLALRIANVMIDRWSGSPNLLRSTTGDTLTMTAGKYIYSIGSSATSPDFATSKPVRLINAFIRDSGNNDTPLDIITKIQYDAIEDKTSQGEPIVVHYDPGAAQQASNVGTLYFYNSPDSAYTLYLESDKYLSEFTNLSDTVTFDPVYYEALIYNIAMRLFRHFRGNESQIPADIVNIANSSMKIVENMNATQPVAKIDVMGTGGKYNVYTDK